MKNSKNIEALTLLACIFFFFNCSTWKKSAEKTSGIGALTDSTQIASSPFDTSTTISARVVEDESLIRGELTINTLPQNTPTDTLFKRLCLNFPHDTLQTLERGGIYISLRLADIDTTLDYYLDYLKQQSLSFLRSHYLKRKATIKELLSEDFSIVLQVDNVQSEIIKDKKFWEKIEFYLIYHTGYSELRLSAFLDAQYSAGFRPPNKEGYLDMKPKFAQHLHEYLQEILNKLKNHLLNGIQNDRSSK